MFAWLTPELRGQLIDGAVITIALTVLTSVASLALGLLAALGRLSNRPLRRRVAGIYVEIFRNVPALILVIFFAFAIPNVVDATTRRTIFFSNPIIDALGDLTGLAIPYFGIAAGLALSLNSGAHLAEIFRSGFSAVPTSRIDAARSLGTSHGAALRQLVVPTGTYIAFPAISNRLIHNMKNTSLASFVAVPELFQAIQGLITRTFRATDLLVLAAILYLILSTVMTVGLRLIEGWLARRDGIAPAGEGSVRV